jgi:hypothetical protein
MSGADGMFESTIGDWPHPACQSDEALLAQCDLTPGRTGGPGGQHRNKVSSAVFLTHTPTGLKAHADERRSAVENKRVALRRLRLALAIGVRVGVPAGPVGSALWRSRCPATGGGHIFVNPDHHDFPAILAEALDVLGAAMWEPAKAAVRLNSTTSQLVKLVSHHRPALELVNVRRAELGMRKLIAR